MKCTERTPKICKRNPPCRDDAIDRGKPTPEETGSVRKEGREAMEKPRWSAFRKNMLKEKGVDVRHRLWDPNTLYIDRKKAPNIYRLIPYTGKKLIGMHFMEGLSPKAKPIHWDTVWGPGRVFNADANKIYSIKLQQVDQGRRMKMVGCVEGFSLLCRTSYWTRITSKKQLNSYRARGAKDLKTYPATHGG